MNKETTFEEELTLRGSIIYKNVGTSMMPMIREGRDVMVISRSEGRLRRFDIPLYKRGDKYILHRVLKVREKDYVIAGDHCVYREYGVTDEDIIGVLTGLYRDGKPVSLDSLGYKLYCHLWCDFYHVRVFILRVKSYLRAAWHRLTHGKGKK